MRKFNFKWFLFCSFVFLFISPQTAWSAEEDRFSITPRVWFTNVNTNLYDSNQSVTSGHSLESTAQVPLQGATITYAPKKFPGIDFLVTGLYGTTTTNYNDASEWGNTDWPRLDVEFLVRKDIPDTTLKLLAGFRHIKYTTDQRETSGGVFTSTGTRLKEFYLSMYFGEFGLSGFNNITSDGKHRMFWNTVGGLGYAKSDRPNRLASQGTSGKESLLWTGDINIGYAYTINKNFGANARYRSFITASHIAGEPSDAREGFIVVHGPEFGLTYNF